MVVSFINLKLWGSFPSRNFRPFGKLNTYTGQWVYISKSQSKKYQRKIQSAYVTYKSKKVIDNPSKNKKVVILKKKQRKRRCNIRHNYRYWKIYSIIKNRISKKLQQIPLQPQRERCKTFCGKWNLTPQSRDIKDNIQQAQQQLSEEQLKRY